MQVEIPADGLGIDRRFTRHADLEIDPEALAPEEIEPAAFLLVQVRLDEDVVALLLDANFDVLEKALRAICASSLDTLARNNSHLARLSDPDGGLTRHVLDA